MNKNNKYCAASLMASFIISIFSIMGCNTTNENSPSTNTENLDGGVEGRLQQLGIVLQEPQAPVANYVNAVTSGNLVYLAGHGPRLQDGNWVTGKLGQNMTIEKGYEAARLAGIGMLASLKAEIGDLDRVVRIVKVLGMVNSAEDFIEQPKVMNGFSNLMVEVFGEKGKHARSAVGMASLPFGIPVEIEMIVEINASVIR